MASTPGSLLPSEIRRPLHPRALYGPQCPSHPDPAVAPHSASILLPPILTSLFSDVSKTHISTVIFPRWSLRFRIAGILTMAVLITRVGILLTPRFSLVLDLPTRSFRGSHVLLGGTNPIGAGRTGSQLLRLRCQVLGFPWGCRCFCQGERSECRADLLFPFRS